MCPADNGFNPMRWNCETQGCFNKFMRPKIEIFAECFPDKIALGDIDATVEMNRHFLHLEFKRNANSIPRGQQIYLRNFTEQSEKNAALIVHADPVSMECFGVVAVQEGRFTDYVPSSQDEVKAILRRWAAHTELPRGPWPEL